METFQLFSVKSTIHFNKRKHISYAEMAESGLEIEMVHCKCLVEGIRGEVEN